VRSSLLVRKQDEMALSGDSLTGIMIAVLAKGKPLRFRARGFSMSPFIKDGDVVTVLPLGASGPRVGDVVAFLFPSTGKSAVHRVVRRVRGSYVLKGDNTSEADGTVSRDRIIGVISRVERAGKRVRLGRGLAGMAVATLSRSGLLLKGLGAARRLSRGTARRARP
jgi:hypothetical protein